MNTDTDTDISLGKYDNSQITICLNMIVKNESRIIVRLLKSVLPIIDTYIICDTGSTDNTPDIIQNFFKNTGITGEIIYEPFKDFGYNRTIALKAARGKATYALLLDADMIFNIGITFDKQKLRAGQYLVLQKCGALSYYNTRLVKLDMDIKCVCPTHEYYELPSGIISERIDSLWIDDIGDGGCKSDKFERDIRLLKSGILDEPENGRYYFYLANSYFNCGQYQESIPYYRKRIAIGGWYEEVFYSHLNLGHAYMKTGQEDKAIITWMDGYNTYPKRAETIYEITKYYRENGKNKIAMAFCMLGRNIPYPSSDNLFIHDNVYNTGFDYELSIIGYYNNYPKLYKIANGLLNKVFSNRSNVISNYKFYCPKIQDYQIGKLGSFAVSEIQNICGIEYVMYGSTPCIFNMDGKYYVNLRMVNYTIDKKSGCYNMFGNNGKIVSSNRILFLDSELFSTSQNKILSSNKLNWQNGITILPWNDDLRYVGIEDLKPFSIGNSGKCIFMGTIQHPQNGNISVGYGNFNVPELYNADIPKLNFSVIETIWNKKCEKNWVFYPLSNNMNNMNNMDNMDSIGVIYSWYPLITGFIKNSNSGKYYFEEEGNKFDMPEFFKDVRGSSHGYLYGNEIWFICHLVEYCHPREYYHFFVVMDHNTMKPIRWSNLFKFEGEKIEFSLGLIIEKEKIIVSYSKWDNEPTIAIYDKNKIENEIF